MPEFRYEAVDRRGLPIHGLLAAADEQELRTRLQRMDQRLISAVRLGTKAVSSAVPQDSSPSVTRILQEGVHTAVLTDLPAALAVRAVAAEPVWNPVEEILRVLRWTTGCLLAGLLLLSWLLQGVPSVLYPLLGAFLLMWGPAGMWLRWRQRRQYRVLSDVADRLEAGEVPDWQAIRTISPAAVHTVIDSSLPDETRSLAVAELLTHNRTSVASRRYLWWVSASSILMVVLPTLLLCGALMYCLRLLEIFSPSVNPLGIELPWISSLILRVFPVWREAPPLSQLLILLATAILLPTLVCWGVFVRGWFSTWLLRLPLVGHTIRWLSLGEFYQLLAVLIRSRSAPADALQLASACSGHIGLRNEAAQVARQLQVGEFTPGKEESRSSVPVSLLLALERGPGNDGQRMQIATTLEMLGDLFQRSGQTCVGALIRFLQLACLLLVTGLTVLLLLAILPPLVQLINNLS